MTESEIATLRAELATTKESLSASNHALAELGHDLRSTRDLVIKLNSKFVLPGDSPLCAVHAKDVQHMGGKLSQLSKDVAALRSWQLAVGFSIAVLVFILNIFAPNIRSALALPTPPPKTSTP